MESNKILSADILDIVFDGRNKEYGAYELRKTYNVRLGRAMAVTGAVMLLLFLSGFVRKHTVKKMEAPQVADIDLKALKTPEPTPPPVIPPAPKAPAVKTVIFTPPKIVPNDKVPDDEKPPVQDDLVKVKIGTVNTEGAADIGITAPPSDNGKTGVVAPPKQQNDDEGGIFIVVQIESSYPGGIQAWKRYLERNMHYPDDAVNNGTQGTVTVQFIVDKEGNVSDVQAVDGPEQDGLREEAVRVIRKSGKWTPAVQNGRHVKSYKRQPVTFQLAQ